MKFLSKGTCLLFVQCVAVGGFLSGAICRGQAACLSIPSGLVSWWAAEGTATDQAGTNNGTLLNSATYLPGEVGQAFSLNGNDGSVWVGDSPSLRFTNALTVEAWIYIKAYLPTRANEIVSKWFPPGGTEGNQASFTTSIDTAGTAHFAISGNGYTERLGPDYVLVNSAHTVPVQQWTHFAATYDGATVKLYLNGVLENQVAWTKGIFPGTSPLVIGSTTVASVFNGRVDEVSLYRRALVDSEILAIYNAGSAGKCGGPPVILAQPQDQTMYAGTNAVFNVGVGGVAPFFYQWFFNGTNISWGTNSILTLTNVQVSQSGSYSVLVSNSISSTMSSNAVLTVNPPPPCLSYSGIVAWWKAEGNALDQAGTNNGTLTAGVSYAPGVLAQTSSQAFDLNGGNVNVADSPSLRLTNALTIEGWIYPRNLGLGRDLVAKWQGVSGKCYMTTIDPAGRPGVMLSMNGQANANGVDHIELYTVTPMLPNTWSHFAATFDGATVKVYLNGVLENQVAWANSIFSGPAPLSIGKTPPLGSALNGLMDETAIFNRALSASEIQALYVNTQTGKCPVPPPNMVLVFGNGGLLTNAQNTFDGPVTVQVQNIYTNGVVFYTTDGSTPTFSSPVYSGAFTVSNSIVLRTLAYSPDFSQGAAADPVFISIPIYTLSATTGGGTIALNPTGGVYFRNTSVTATATPASGWTFLQWLEDADGTNPVATVTMSADKSIKAIFGTTLTTGGTGNGSVIPATAAYPYGAVVAVSAIPDSGNYFAGWNNSSNANPLYLPITNANPSISALFQTLAGGEVALAVIPNGHGRVTVTPNANNYAVGAGVTLTAIPDPAQSFIGWSGDATGTSNPLGITMNQSKVVTANFTHKSTLSVAPPEGGVTDQGFRLTLDGDLGAIYRLDSSTGFANWLPMVTLTNSYGKLQFVDPQGTNSPRRLYRAVQIQ